MFEFDRKGINKASSKTSRLLLLTRLEMGTGRLFQNTAVAWPGVFMTVWGRAW